MFSFTPNVFIILEINLITGQAYLNVVTSFIFSCYYPVIQTLSQPHTLTLLGGSFHSSYFLAAYGKTRSLMICRVVRVMARIELK